ncbi:cell wall-binding repeat-containing protein [Mahella sp.]|uniref:cell wall-binding repeat-containing protein n=1 Tax=Mahella sp. TaxID=2798721 RepID=UPI0025BAEBAE|nr:cell wall-binding repeat-containing protein [Mahella sp.]MBZ4666188.1 transglutaminase protein [Mahella sp.]
MRKRIFAIIVVIAFLLTLVSGIIAAPTYAAAAYQRLEGADRYGTSAAISKSGWQTADTVVIALGDDFPDGLTGGPLAYKLDAPLLLTRKDKLPDAVKQEIARLKPKKAYILGGPKVISDSVKQALEDNGITVERVYGEDRAATAAEIAKIIGAPTGKAVIATGRNFPDALAISPIAAANNMPVLFVYGSTIPAATLQALKDMQIEQVDVLGGDKIIPQAIVDKLKSMGISVRRIYGGNRELTALEIAKAYGAVADGTFVATGYDYADALSVAPLAAKKGQPLLLCGKDKVDKGVSAYIINSGLTIDKVTVAGGEGVVSDTTVFKLFTPEIINIYKMDVNDQVKYDGSITKTIDFITDNVLGAVLYRMSFSYPTGDSLSPFEEYRWITTGFSLNDDGKASFDIPFFLGASPSDKGNYLAKIHALDANENILVSSEIFPVEIDARDASGRLIVYNKEQLSAAISSHVDFVISDNSTQMKEYYNKAKTIISKIIKPGMTDLQKEKAVHDYIVNNVRYDIKNYNNNTVPDESYSPYGALVKGVAVCEGYAWATKLLLNMAGIESTVVEGGGHAWNIVKINGKCYHLDTTWDEPVTSNDKNILRYDYFNLNDAQIGKDHFWDRNKYPACPKPGPRP